MSSELLHFFRAARRQQWYQTGLDLETAGWQAKQKKK